MKRVEQEIDADGHPIRIGITRYGRPLMLMLPAFSSILLNGVRPLGVARRTFLHRVY